MKHITLHKNRAEAYEELVVRIVEPDGAISYEMTTEEGDIGQGYVLDLVKELLESEVL